MPTSASVEQDGIRLTMAFGANPMYAGNRTSISITLENVGDETLWWLNDGCDTNVHVTGTMDVSFEGSELAVDPALAPYRGWLRERIGAGDPVSLQASRSPGTPARNSGCGDVGLTRSLEPGETVTQWYAWDGYAAPRLGLPPSGDVTWAAEFPRWWRGGAHDESDVEDRPVRLESRSFIVGGRRSDAISPAAAVDAALGHAPFAAWIVTRPLRSGADAIAEYDPATGLWVVGLLTNDDLEYGDPALGTLHAVLVDPITSAIVGEFEAPAPF